MENKQWIIFWINNHRIGSLELTDETRNEAKSMFNMNLIQKDITGTEHYEVYGMKKISIKDIDYAEAEARVSTTLKRKD